MEAPEQIKRFKEFFDENYTSEILEAARTDKRFIITEFSDLSKFDPELAQELLEQPEEVVRAAEIAIESFETESKNFRIRFKCLPASQKLLIRDIRSKHLNKFYSFDGIVRQKTDVRPQVTSAKFECPSCGSVISILQFDKKFKEPSRCNCGRKGKCRLIGKELVDFQLLVIEELPELLESGAQPKRMNVFLKEDLVSPLSETKTNPGSKIIVNGVVKEEPVILRSGAQATRYELLIEANYVESTEEDFGSIELSKEDEAEIKEIAEDPRLMPKLIDSLAPGIFGLEKVKEALLYQIAGGVKKVRSDGVVTRGDIHVLLIGDPGCCAAGTYVSMADGSFRKIETLGKHHLQEISHNVIVDRYNQNENPYAKAITFFKYPSQKTYRITTETGKELVCNGNHPLYVKARNHNKT
ncbi:MAG: hypothetical protein V1734_03560, partial [Nanoarchaeota archaeon]